MQMQLGQQLRDQFRSLLNIRTPRQLPVPGPKPRIGSTIYRGEVRILVQAGLSDELWLWLTAQGWREPSVTPDRRRYRDMPASIVTRLFDAAPDEWLRLLTAGVSRATTRPTLNPRQAGPRTIPSSMVRK